MSGIQGNRIEQNIIIAKSIYVFMRTLVKSIQNVLEYYVRENFQGTEAEGYGFFVYDRRIA